MYSGTTLTRMSGRVLGAHQKIDRVARKQLMTLLPDRSIFPSSHKILHFEGKNGPDAIKRKSPAVDEPWHYFDPFDDTDTQLLELIANHYKKLVGELKAGNTERTAFEAAWLAHALVDGLTPAHHYPYEEKLKELRGGAGIETRTSIKDKWVLPGATRTEQVRNNWKMWGSKGLIMTHGMFEMGIATIIAPLQFGDIKIKPSDIHTFQTDGMHKWFRDIAREIAVLDMYKNYYEKGWTPKLAWQVRHKLTPTLITTVALAWYGAVVDAGLVSQKS